MRDKCAKVVAIGAVLCAIWLAGQNYRLSTANARLADYATVRLDSLEKAMEGLAYKQTRQIEALRSRGSIAIERMAADR